MRANTAIMAAAFVWSVAAFWHRNELPSAVELVPAIDTEPRQRPTKERPFVVEYDGTEYRVEPEFD